MSAIGHYATAAVLALKGVAKLDHPEGHGLVIDALFRLGGRHRPGRRVPPPAARARAEGRSPDLRPGVRGRRSHVGADAPGGKAGLAPGVGGRGARVSRRGGRPAPARRSARIARGSRAGAMPTIEVTSVVAAPPQHCFDLSRDIDLHVRSMAGTGERAVGGRTAGLIGPGEEVTWQGRHFGVERRFTSWITAFRPPGHFQDTMVRGAFRSFVHDHFFDDRAGRRHEDARRPRLSVAPRTARRPRGPPDPDAIPHPSARRPAAVHSSGRGASREEVRGRRLDADADSRVDTAMTDGEDRRARGDRKIIHDVNTYGWHVMKVMPQGDDPGWAYSIGMFRTLGHPEVLVFGLRDASMHEIINGVGERVRAGARFEDGVEDGDTLEGYRCAFRTVASRWYAPLLGFAKWFYGGNDFPVLQLFWPDGAGSYPWDSSYPEDMLPLQPLLYEVDATRARATSLLESLENESLTARPRRAQRSPNDGRQPDVAVPDARSDAVGRRRRDGHASDAAGPGRRRCTRLGRRAVASSRGTQTSSATSCSRGARRRGGASSPRRPHPQRPIRYIM